jgi:hypothetical protein
MRILDNIEYVAHPRDWVLFLQVLSCLVAIRAVIGRMKLMRLLEWLEPEDGRRLDPSRLTHVTKFSNFVVYDLFRSENPCLYRSLVLYRFLRMMGMEVSIAFAVKRDTEVLAGHAWIVKDGRPFLDHGGPAAAYEPVFVYPRDIPRDPGRGRQST